MCEKVHCYKNSVIIKCLTCAQLWRRKVAKRPLYIAIPLACIVSRLGIPLSASVLHPLASLHSPQPLPAHDCPAWNAPIVMLCFADADNKEEVSKWSFQMSRYFLHHLYSKDISAPTNHQLFPNCVCFLYVRTYLELYCMYLEFMTKTGLETTQYNVRKSKLEMWIRPHFPGWWWPNILSPKSQRAT